MRLTYHYQGVCPQTGQILRLERSLEAETAARQLMEELPRDLAEGKMFGLLITAEGQLLRAFSGHWQGQPELPGWVPPIMTHSPSPVPAELQNLSAQIKDLAGRDCFEQARQLREHWKQRLQQVQQHHREAKLERDRRRQCGEPALDLNRESQHEGMLLRQLRARRQLELQGPEQAAAQTETQILQLKRRRRELSAQLQGEMHLQRSMCLSAGQPWSLASLFPSGPPTGTGECCAPKLLHRAAALGLTPLAMAEFWWGPAAGGREPGQFYAACQERCQPLIGPLLARARPLEILHQDEHLLAVHKPPGVLCLPGRQDWNQDSLWGRLLPHFPELLPVHRLDLETSGVLLWARNPHSQRHLQAQFAERCLEKTYEALLSHPPDRPQGRIELALAADPERPGCYRPDPDGKACLTDFRQLEDCRIEFRPHTGRSHQLRVHAAYGLRSPIAGDSLYGGGPGPLRLHASRLQFTHPLGGQLVVEASPPF